MKFEALGSCLVEVDVPKGEKTGRITSTSIRLEVSHNQEAFTNEKGLPTEEGTQMLTQCLVEGLVANIHAGHQNGHWDSAKHLRFIIERLELGFVQIVEIREGEM